MQYVSAMPITMASYGPSCVQNAVSPSGRPSRRTQTSSPSLAGPVWVADAASFPLLLSELSGLYTTWCAVRWSEPAVGRASGGGVRTPCRRAKRTESDCIGSSRVSSELERILIIRTGGVLQRADELH